MGRLGSVALGCRSADSVPSGLHAQRKWLIWPGSFCRDEGITSSSSVLDNALSFWQGIRYLLITTALTLTSLQAAAEATAFGVSTAAMWGLGGLFSLPHLGSVLSASNFCFGASLLCDILNVALLQRLRRGLRSRNGNSCFPKGGR